MLFFLISEFFFYLKLTLLLFWSYVFTPLYQSFLYNIAMLQLSSMVLHSNHFLSFLTGTCKFYTHIAYVTTIFIIVKIVSCFIFFLSEVCLKKALQFPDKCSFSLQAAQTYFKTGTFNFSGYLIFSSILKSC